MRLQRLWQCRYNGTDRSAVTTALPEKAPTERHNKNQKHLPLAKQALNGGRVSRLEVPERLRLFLPTRLLRFPDLSFGMILDNTHTYIEHA